MAKDSCDHELLHEILRRVEQKIDYMNGSICKNTAWRIQSKVYFTISGALILGLLFPAIVRIMSLAAN